METPVTMIRLHVPESSHSAHRAQMEKILHFLGSQLHVRGLSVSMGRREAGAPPPQRYEGVGDLLRGKLDPPTIIEFFDEPSAAQQIRRKLCELAPDGYVVSWPAIWEAASSQGGARSTTASGA